MLSSSKQGLKPHKPVPQILAFDGLRLTMEFRLTKAVMLSSSKQGLKPHKPVPLLLAFDGLWLTKGAQADKSCHAEPVEAGFEISQACSSVTRLRRAQAENGA